MKGPGFVPVGAVVNCIKMAPRGEKDGRFGAFVFYLVLREIQRQKRTEPGFERIGIVHYKDVDAAKYEHLERMMTVKILCAYVLRFQFQTINLFPSMCF